MFKHNTFTLKRSLTERPDTSLICLQQSSAVPVHQARTINATVGDTAGAHQHTMTSSTREVAVAAHRAVILALGATELQTQPKPRGKVCRAEVTDERHLVGTTEQHLHAHVEADLSVGAGGGDGPCCASRNMGATADRAPPAQRVGEVS